MPAEGLRARQADARAPVLTTVIVSAETRMIAMAGSFSRVTVGTSMGVEGAACITVATETLMYWDRGVLSAALRCLVDQRVPARPLRERALADIELASPRQRALCLLRHRTLEQCANLMVGLMILRHRGL